MTRNIQQLPNNSGATSIIEVPSSTGFNAGDLIWVNNGNYSTIPNSLATTGTFNISATNQPTYSNTVGGLVTPLTQTAFGASALPNYAAVLTNGNIVTVYQKCPSISDYVYFQINTSAGVAVVAETLVSSTYYPNSNSGCAGVIALSGGGFVVYYVDSTGHYPTYAVYTNTGSVTTALQRDTSITGLTTSPFIIGVAQANGGFVLALTNTSNQPYFRIYGSTGTGLYGATATANTSASGVNAIGLACRSDSSFCIAYSNSTSIYYQVVSATNSSIVSSSITVTASSYFVAVSVGVLTNNTFVIGYGNNNLPVFNLLPTGNTLGSAVTIPFNTVYPKTSTTACNITILGLANGTFVAMFYEYASATINWIFYNSSGTALSSTNQIYQGYIADQAKYISFTLIESSGVVNCYYTQGQQNKFNEQSFFQISESTYNYITPSTTTTVSNVVSSQSASVNGWSRTGSTPNSAQFLASTTQTLTFTGGATTGSVTPNVVSSTAAYCLHSCSLNNGSGFAVVYAQNFSPYNVYLNTYNATGTFTNSVLVGKSGLSSSSSYYDALKVCCLSSGKIAVAFYSSGGQVTVNLYSTSLSLIGTFLIKTVVTASIYYGISMCGLTNDRFIVTYIYDDGSGNNFPYYYIFSNTCTNINGSSNVGTSITSADAAHSSVGASASGGFWFYYYYSSSPYIIYFYNVSGNTFSQLGSVTAAPFTTRYYHSSLAVTSNNTCTAMTGSATTNLRGGANSAGSYGWGLMSTTVTYGDSLYAGFAICSNSYGETVLVGVQQSITATTSGAMSIVTSAGGTYNTGTSATTITGVTTAPYPVANVSNLYGGFVVLTWLNSSQYPSFVILNSHFGNLTTNLVAGTTPTSVAPFSPIPTNGYTFIGVAVTNCTAGGTGQVQINGAAQLNSSYGSSTSYSAFDHTQPGQFGSRGFMVGQNVIMQGNS